MQDSETGEIYLTDEQEYSKRLEEKIDLYDNFKRVLKDLIYDCEEIGSIKIEDLKEELNTLECELKAVG